LGRKDHEILNPTAASVFDQDVNSRRARVSLCLIVSLKEVAADPVDEISGSGASAKSAKGRLERVLKAL
jgi:hypothetical protein